MGGHLDVVQLLYSAGADIDSQDNRKVSCLMAAFRKGHSKTVKWMVKHVTQFPSDAELTRYIATIGPADKDLLKPRRTHPASSRSWTANPSSSRARKRPPPESRRRRKRRWKRWARSRRRGAGTGEKKRMRTKRR